jgi:pimeloyl-ACP methyl ester carboxylesterase
MHTHPIKKQSFIFFMFLSCKLLSQDLGLLSALEAKHFQLKNPKDTIDFILINGNTTARKAALIFCQGSNPAPLVTILPNGKKFFTSMNFDCNKIAKDYHIILISMPHTPVEVPKQKLNNNYSFVSDTSNPHSYHPAYLAANYAENYVRRTKDVINFLSAQTWVDARRIILFGHSQGSEIAVGAAINNPKIFKVGYASGNPLGRIDQLIREQRKRVAEGKITQEEGQKEIENIYEMWRQINESPNAVTTEFGDPNRTWTSFSRPLIDDLLKIKQPLYVVYGTADITATFCDLLPIYFISAHKTNLTLKPYPGLEHNYFEVGKDGSPIYEKGHWQEVMDNFLLWAER